MKKEYEILKEEIGGIFEFVKEFAISQENIEKSKLEMNLKIIQAVVMRFIRIIIFQKNQSILCTSVEEIMEYVNTGFLRYFDKNKDRKLILEKAKRIEKILLNVESIDEKFKIVS